MASSTVPIASVVAAAAAAPAVIISAAVAGGKGEQSAVQVAVSYLRPSGAHMGFG